MSIRLFVWSVFCVTLIFPAMGQNDPVFYAEMASETVYQGAEFKVEYQLSGARGSAFRPPDFGPFVVTSGPTRSYQTTIVNGQVDQYEGYNYVLRADRIGNYRISPATIRVNGKVIKSNPLDVNVRPPLTQEDLKVEASNTDKSFFIQAELSDDTAYVGQKLLLNYRLFTKVDVQRVQYVNRPNLPDFDMNIVLIGDDTQEAVVELNGERYVSKMVARLALYPIKPGDYRIDATQFQVMVSTQNRRGFFFDNYKINNTITNGLKVLVLPLPEPSPEDFTGLVGRYEMRVDPGKPSLTTDDVISVKTELIGDGDARRYDPKDFIHSPELEAYEPKVIAGGEEDANKHLRHRVITEHFFASTTPGKYFVQPRFTYFNVDSHRYESLMTDTLYYTMIKGASLGEISGDHTDGVQEYKRTASPSKETSLWISKPWGWILWIVSAWVFIGAIGHTWWKQYRESRKPPLTDEEVAEQALNELRSAPGKQAHKIEDIIHQYVRKKAGVRPSEWTPEDLTSYAQEHMSYEEADSLTSFLNRCRMSAYAGVTVNKKDDWIEQAREWVRRL